MTLLANADPIRGPISLGFDPNKVVGPKIHATGIEVGLYRSPNGTVTVRVSLEGTNLSGVVEGKEWNTVDAALPEYRRMEEKLYTSQYVINHNPRKGINLQLLD